MSPYLINKGVWGRGSIAPYVLGTRWRVSVQLQGESSLDVSSRNTALSRERIPSALAGNQISILSSSRPQPSSYPDWARENRSICVPFSPSGCFNCWWHNHQANSVFQLATQPGCYSYQRCLLVCFNASPFYNTTLLSCLNSNLSNTNYFNNNISKQCPCSGVLFLIMYTIFLCSHITVYSTKDNFHKWADMCKRMAVKMGRKQKPKFPSFGDVWWFIKRSEQKTDSLFFYLINF